MDKEFVCYSGDPCDTSEKLPPGICCHPWYNAINRGTDNEGYSCAICGDDDSKYKIGLIYEKINFCPWCGVKK